MKIRIIASICRRALIIIALIIVALMVSAGNAMGETDSADSLLQSSSNLSYNGHYDLALIGVEKLLNLSENSQEGWYLKGEILSRSGRHQEAIKAYDRALNIDPFKPDYWLGRGRSLDNLSRYPEAVYCYDRIIDCYEGGLIKPKVEFEGEMITKRILMINHFLAWYYKGQDYERMGRYGDAVNCFDKSIGLYKEGQKDRRSDINSEEDLYSSAQLEKGIALMYLAAKGDNAGYEKAIGCFNETIKSSSSNALRAEAWYDNGLARLFLKDSRSAEVCFDESIKEDNGSKAWAPWFSKGIALRNLGRQKEAGDAFEKAVDKAMEIKGVKKASLLDIIWSWVDEHLPHV